MKKSLLLLLIMMTLVCMVALSACGGTAEKPAAETPPAQETPAAEESEADEWPQDYSWKIATVETTTTSPANVWAETFEKYIEEASEGHIQVEVYYGGTLGDGSDLTEMALNNTIQWFMADAGQIYPFFPEIGILNLHYLFPTEMEDVFKFCNESESMATLAGYLYDKDVKVWRWSTEGGYYVTSSKALITKPADFQSLRFRTMATEIEAANFQAYGANTAVIAFSELYTALQLGTVDAQQQPSTGIYNMKFYEVQDYATNMKHAQYFLFPISSVSFYEELPEEVLALVEECWDKATVDYNEYITQRAQFGWDVLSTDECGPMETYILTEEEIEPFRELAKGVWDKYIEIVGGSDTAANLVELFSKEVAEKY